MFPFLMLVLLGQASSPPEPPLAGRPLDFSGLAGFWRIRAALDKKEVELEQPVVLDVAVQTDGPVHTVPSQESLQLFPKDAQEKFFIEPFPERNQAHPDRNLWVFSWRLRPKSVEIKETPGLELAYWYPARKRYQRSYADPIPLKVLPPVSRAESLPEAKTMRFPPETLRLLMTEEKLERSADGAGTDAFPLGTGLTLPPVLCLLWFLAWRRHARKSNQRAGRTSSRAAQAAIRRLHERNDADSIAAVIRDYLEQRLGFVPREPTSEEVLLFLARRGADRPLLAAWKTFLATCEEARFSPVPGENPAAPARQIVTETERWIHQSRDSSQRLSAGAACLALFACVAGAPAESGTRPEQFRSTEVLARARSLFLAACADGTIDRKKAAAAAECFSVLVRTGYGQPDLHHDFGNALMLAERLPEAVLQYRLGLEMDPDHSPLRACLSFARSQVLYGRNEAGRPVPDERPFWLPRVTPLQAAWLGILAYAMSCVLVTRWLMVHRRGLLLGASAAIVLAVACGLLSLELQERRRQRAERPLVVLSGETILRIGNAEVFPRHPSLPVLGAGMEARFLHRRGDWVMIRFDTGETGWVPGAALLSSSTPLPVGG